MKNTLALGGPLTPETFQDFVSRLKNDIAGQRVNDHCTADAIFIVERAVIVTGIDLDFSPPKLITNDEQESYWFSPLEYWNSLSHEEQGSVDQDCFEREKKPFLSLTEDEQWGFIERSDYPYVYGYSKHWEFINANLTYDAAVAFITKHGHKHEGELRINVDSRYRTPEINAVIDALITGQLVLNTPDSDNRAALVSLDNVNEQLKRAGIDEGSAQLGVMKLMEQLTAVEKALDDIRMLIGDNSIKTVGQVAYYVSDMLVKMNEAGISYE